MAGWERGRTADGDRAAGVGRAVGASPSTRRSTSVRRAPRTVGRRDVAGSSPPAGTSDDAVAWLAGLRGDLSAAAGGWARRAPVDRRRAGWTSLGGEEPGGPATDRRRGRLAERCPRCARASRSSRRADRRGAFGDRREAVWSPHRPAPHGTSACRLGRRRSPGAASATHLAVLQIGVPGAEIGRGGRHRGPRRCRCSRPTTSPHPEESAAIAFRFDRPDAARPTRCCSPSLPTPIAAGARGHPGRSRRRSGWPRSAPSTSAICPSCACCHDDAAAFGC